MAFRWNRELIEKLILSVQQYPCLYNIKSAEYLDRIKKAQAFNHILNEISKSESTMTLEEIKRKWKILRTQFMREKRFIQQSKRSGAGTNDIYVPKLWCFEHLKFLQSHVEMRATIDNTVESEETIIYCSTDEESLIEERPRKRKKVAINEFRKDLDDFKNVLNKKKEPKKFSWLGNLVASQMESINEADQDDAAWQVQCLMRRLTRNSTTNHSCSTNSSSKDILELSMEGLFDDEEI